MIPLRLTLGGVYSYQQPQTIDFARLTEASIFGIFGTVGSGKSTILEAISYALYGETERLHQRESRGYNMMNLKSNELLIDFVFRAGGADTEYRFKVNGKRNRNHFDRINTFERTAYQREGANWIPIEADSAERIIGLSYPNFRRTIIIPQGKFQEFLQLSDTDRTRMMRELFNLDKYELYRKVDGLEKKNNDEKLLLEDRLRQTGEVDAAGIQTRRESLARLQQLLEETDHSLLEKRQVDGAFAQLKELFERMERQRQVWSRLQTRTDEFADLERRIERYEHCRLYFKDLLDNHHAGEVRMRTLSEAAARQRTQRNELAARLAREESALDELRVRYDTREALRGKAEEMEKIAGILKLEAGAAQLREQLSNGEMHFSRASYQVGQIRQEQAALSTATKALRAALSDPADLAAAGSWFAVDAQLRAAKKSLLEEAEGAAARLRQLETQRYILARAVFRSRVPVATEEAPLAEWPERLREARAELEAQLARTEGEWQHLLLQAKLADYAQALREGEPCPLCGSTEHSHQPDAAHDGQRLTETEGRKRTLQTQLQQLDHSEKQLHTLAVQHAGQNEVREGIVHKLDTQTVRLAKHRRDFIWPDFRPDDEAHFQETWAESKRRQKEVTAQERRQEELAAKLVAEEQNRDKFRNLLEKRQRELAGITAQVNLYRGQIRQLDPGEYAHFPPETLEQEARQWMSQYRRLETDYRAGEQALSALRIGAGTLSGTLQSTESTLAHAQAEADVLRRKLDEQLMASAFTSPEEVRAILNSSLDLETEKSRSNAFRQDLHTARVQHQTLVEQAQGKCYDAAAHAELLADIARLRQERNEQGEQAVLLKREIGGLEKNLHLRKELLGKRDALQQRAEDLGTLKKLFRESGFVNYVSSVYLQNLCHAANERFH
ncbi:MAG: AAA family ATPase, partial [Ferruginibacter sp.]|nr:AAA family ATPase [Cytophagales bacterium]